MGIGSARLRASLALLSFCVGLAVSWEWNGSALLPSSMLFVLAVLCAGISLALGRRGAASAVCVSLLCFGAGWGTLRLRERSDDALGVVLPADKASILRLMLLDMPRRAGTVTSETTHDAWTALAQCDSIVTDEGDIAASGKVWLRVPGEAGVRRSGDRLIVRGVFRPVLQPGNPGEFDLERWARDRGIEGSFRAMSALMVRPDESKATWREIACGWWLRGIAALRSRGNTVLDTTTRGATDESREVLRGLLLGEEPNVPSDGLRAFYRLGLAHILSISGFHLVVFAGAVMFVLRLFGDLGKLEPLLIALAIVLFLGLVPPSSPLVRAAAILLTLLIAEFFGRRYDRLTLLCWVAIGVLIVRPSELWSLGFQLSFGLAGALLGLSAGLLERLFPLPLGRRASERGWKRWLVRGSQGLFVTGLLCWGLSAPWVGAKLGIFNPIAVLTGFLVTPLVALILWIGYAAILAGMIVPGMAGVAGAALTTLSDLCVRVVLWLDSLPGATVRLPWISVWWAGAATVLLAYWFWRARLRVRLCLVLACVLVVWGGVEMLFANRLPSDVVARIHVLDVERGNCIVMQTNERTVMIGAGANSAGGRDLPTIARQLGAWRLDALLLFLGDEESAQGSAEVIRTLLPERVVLVGDGETSGEAWAQMRAEVATFRTPVERMDWNEAASSLGLGRVIERLHPEDLERQGRGMLSVEYRKDGVVQQSVWRRSGPISITSQNVEGL